MAMRARGFDSAVTPTMYLDTITIKLHPDTMMRPSVELVGRVRCGNRRQDQVTTAIIRTQILSETGLALIREMKRSLSQSVEDSNQEPVV